MKKNNLRANFAFTGVLNALLLLIKIFKMLIMKAYSL